MCLYFSLIHVYKSGVNFGGGATRTYPIDVMVLRGGSCGGGGGFSGRLVRLTRLCVRLRRTIRTVSTVLLRLGLVQAQVSIVRYNISTV